MSLLLLALVAIILFGPTILLLLLSSRKRPLQFSLRGLFLALTVVALILGGIGWWRVATMARLRWLDPAVPEAKALFPPSEFSPTADGEWAIVYRSQCVPIHDLDRQAMAVGAKIRGSHSTRWDAEEAQIEIVGTDRESIEAYIAALRDADQLGSGRMVIRGRVVDSDGTPVSDAIVDLMGPYVYINHFRTRDDGTFVMPIAPRPGWGFYLRIRPQDGERRSTPRFSLDHDEPERVAIVRLP